MNRTPPHGCYCQDLLVAIDLRILSLLVPLDIK